MELNKYSYVHGNPVNGAVGELLGLINGYSYANGNPVNLVDPSGMCAQPTQWGNPIDVNCYYSADGLARRFSNGDPNLYQVYFDVLIQKTWEELKIIEATGTFADITGGAQQFLDNALIIPDLFVQNPQLLLQALNQYLFGCGSSNVALGTAAPAFGRSPQVFFVVVGGIAVAATFLGAYTLLKQLTQSPTVGNTQSYEFRLSGFDRKVGLIAAHLAKVLGYEVAGYPPSGPNPGDRATRGWCVEIRNFIQQIDNAGYTERQLNRDLEAAGISTEVWNTIKAAVRAAAEKCNDHWDDFTGGSLATG